MCYKTNAIAMAYASGVRRCPCCNVQLVWKSNTHTVQRNLATVDHIVPKSKGGGDTIGNVFVMCRQCNADRGNQPFVGFVSARGLSVEYATVLAKEAHVASARVVVTNLLNQVKCVQTRKTLKSRLKAIMSSYRSFFDDCHDQFNLFPAELLK